MSNLKRNGRLRWAPSYLRNRGKMTRAQKEALRNWWDLYGLRFAHGERVDLDAAFPGAGPLAIEIGFGMGDHLVRIARAMPDRRFLGIEVHRPGLAAATRKIHEAGLENVRLIRGDARLVLTDHLAEGIASAVLIQYPDPWPNPGDSHRRIVQPGMIRTIRGVLVPGGELQLVTDVPGYDAYFRTVMADEEGWEESTGAAWSVPDRGTLYGARAQEEGRSRIERWYRRVREGTVGA